MSQRLKQTAPARGKQDTHDGDIRSTVALGLLGYLGEVEIVSMFHALQIDLEEHFPPRQAWQWDICKRNCLENFETGSAVKAELCGINSIV